MPSPSRASADAEASRTPPHAREADRGRLGDGASVPLDTETTSAPPIPEGHLQRVAIPYGVGLRGQGDVSFLPARDEANTNSRETVVDRIEHLEVVDGEAQRVEDVGVGIVDLFVPKVSPTVNSAE